MLDPMQLFPKQDDIGAPNLTGEDLAECGVEFAALGLTPANLVIHLE